MFHPLSLLQMNYYKYLLNSMNLNNELSIALQVKIKVQKRDYCIFIWIINDCHNPCHFSIKGQVTEATLQTKSLPHAFKNCTNICKILTIQQMNVHNPGQYFNCLQLQSPSSSKCMTCSILPQASSVATSVTYKTVNLKQKISPSSRQTSILCRTEMGQ